MKMKMKIPAWVFGPTYSENKTVETIRRQDNILEIEFPVFDKPAVLAAARKLAQQKRRAHDRPIDDLLDILDQVYDRWMDPNYDLRKEAMEVIPMMTGQARILCELELNGSIALYQRKTAELFLQNEIGGKKYLEKWIPKGNIRVHAQPRGVLYHNLAGNTFNVGLVSLFYGLISKNVNMIKLPHEEPYFAVRLAQSLEEVDKKIGKEMAILYWPGRESEIFNELFASRNIDCIIAWGGLRSIEDIRRRSYHYGIKMIDHGPKLSFSIISEKIFQDPLKLEELTKKLATDIVFWNQKACLSPRVVYIMEEERKTGINTKNNKNSHYNKNKKKKNYNNNSASQSASNPMDIAEELYSKLTNHSSSGNVSDLMGKKSKLGIDAIMQRDVQMLQRETSDRSPLGFAKKLAEQMAIANSQLPRAHLTESDGMDMAKKREYFTLKYELYDNGVLLMPNNNQLDWTVAYLRRPPTLHEIERCFNRFVIVTRISSLYDLVQLINRGHLNIFLQTISVYGSDDFITKVAEEFSLIGASRFPRVGEHNIQSMGAPWDGHYILQNLVRWAFIGFNSYNPNEDDGPVLNLKAENGL